MTQSTQSPKSIPCVHFLEVTAVSLGAIALVGAAVWGVVNQITTKMNQPHHVEKIAKHFLNYQFPTTSIGQTGLSIGGESFAIVTDKSENPSLRLFVQTSPVNRVERTSTLVRKSALDSVWNGTWESVTEQDKPFKYCDQVVNLEINRGSWTLNGSDQANPAIEYTLDVTLGTHDQVIRILSTGADAEGKAQALLKSLSCHQRMKNS